MHEIDLAILQSDDWDAVYVDGYRVYSGHENLIDIVLDEISGKTVRSTMRAYAEAGTPAGDYLFEHGDYPEVLGDLPPLRG